MKKSYCDLINSGYNWKNILVDPEDNVLNQVTWNLVIFFEKIDFGDVEFYPDNFSMNFALEWIGQKCEQNTTFTTN